MYKTLLYFLSLCWGSHCSFFQNFGSIYMTTILNSLSGGLFNYVWLTYFLVFCCIFVCLECVLLSSDFTWLSVLVSVYLANQLPLPLLKKQPCVGDVTWGPEAQGALTPKTGTQKETPVWAACTCRSGKVMFYSIAWVRAGAQPAWNSWLCYSTEVGSGWFLAWL